MILLPIAERELRVATRKRSTVWFRVLAALLAILIGTGFLAMSLAFDGGTVRLGSSLFGTLTWLALASALAAGLFFTADSLSEEKREGTLGFIFLTDLRGYDVIGGKLLATSLRGSYAMLALFPVLAVTLIMGGVTGMQFFKSVLALVNALFCSLSVGLLVSSISRDPQRAMGGTFLLLLALCAGGPIADSIVTGVKGSGYSVFLRFTSPVYVFWAASAWGRAGYWVALLASNLVGCSCLAMACLLIPRTWQDRTGRFAARAGGRRRYSFKYGRASARAARRRKLIEPNPVLWLALREQWLSVAAWALLLLIGVMLVASVVLSHVLWILWAQINSLVLLVLYLWTASQASRFFVDARRSGLMELLLVTPLTDKDIVLGQWRAQLKLFGPMAALLLIVQSGAMVLSQNTSTRIMGGTPGLYAPSLALSLITGLISGLGTLSNLVALSWFGMWMGLVSKNGSIATLRTLIFVQVLPWLGISFASMMISASLMFGGATTGSNSLIFNFQLIVAVVTSAMTVAKSAAFFLWSRNRLFSEFRSKATELPAAARDPIIPLAPLNPRPPSLPAR
jgi:hypothetical protein